MPRVHRCRALGCHNVVEWPARYCAQHKSLEATADEKKRDYWKYNHITRNRSVMSDASNLVTCCKSCHQAKTAWEKTYYGTGQANALKGSPRLRDVKRIVELIDRLE